MYWGQRRPFDPVAVLLDPLTVTGCTLPIPAALWPPLDAEGYDTGDLLAQRRGCYASGMFVEL